MDGILIVYGIKRQKMGPVFECNFFLHLLEEKTMAALSLSLLENRSTALQVVPFYNLMCNSNRLLLVAQKVTIFH